MPDAASQTDIVIAGAARTPMGGFQGELSPMTAPQLGGAAISAARRCRCFAGCCQ